MILPIEASSFGEALQMGSETYHHLKVIYYSFPLNCLVLGFHFQM